MIKQYRNKYSFYIIATACLFLIFFVNGKLLILSALLFTLIFILFIRGNLAIINHRLFIWLGGISYSLYLVPYNIGYIIINSLKHINLNYFLHILIPTVVSLSIAIFVTYYIERPALFVFKESYFFKQSLPSDQKNPILLIRQL